MIIVLAWLAGEGIVFYRWAKNGAPPPPGAVAAASLLFLGCAALASYQPAKVAASAFAVGVDLAVLLNVLPGGNSSQVTNWPPDYIPCGQLLPSAGAGVPVKPDCGAPGGSATNPANTPAAVGGANKANDAPASTPANPGVPPQPGTPSPGHGVIYPPGSQNL